MMITLLITWLAFANAQTQFDLDLSFFPSITAAHIVPNLVLGELPPYGPFYEPKYDPFKPGEFPFGPGEFPEGEGEYYFKEFGDIATRVLVEFNTSVDFSTFDTLDPQFLCSDLLDFFEGAEREDLERRENCRLCIESSPDDNLAILVIPDFVEFDILQPDFERELQEEGELDLTTPKFIQIRDRDDPVPIIELPDFRLEKAVQSKLNQFILVFSEPVHMVRGRATTDPVTTFCDQVFSSRGFRDFPGECTFSFQDNLVFVDVLDFVPPFVAFDLDNPSFFSIEDTYGLKPSLVEFQDIRPLPKLLSSIHEITGSVLFTFDTDLDEVDNERILCSRILSFEVEGEEFEGELFGNRNDIFCSVSFVSARNVRVDFPEIVPFFPSVGEVAEFKFQFKEDEPVFVTLDRLSFATNEEALFEGDGAVYEGITFSVLGPNDLTRCDDSFTIDFTQVGGLNILSEFSISSDSSTSPDFEGIFLDEICTIFSTTVVCDTTGVADILEGENFDGTLTYDFIFEVTAIFLTEDDILDEPIASTDSLFVFQDFGQQKVPIQISGIDINNVVENDRGFPITFTAVLGDVFGCAAVNNTSAIQFEWSIESVEDSNLVLPSAITKIFSLKGDDLPVGTFTVTLNADAPDLIGVIAPNSVSFELRINPVEVVLISSSGTDQTVSLEDVEVLVLDASRSCNPNQVDAQCQNGLGFVDTAVLDEVFGNVDEELDLLGLVDFELEWFCVDCGDLDEDVLFQNITRNETRLEIPISNFGEFEPEEIANFIFGFAVVGEDEDTIPEPLQVNVNLVTPPEDCFLPIVQINPVDAKVNTNGAVSITSIVEEEDVSFQWVETVLGGVPVFDPTSIQLERSALFIPANTLSENAEYTYTLTVSAGCGDPGDPQTSVSTSVSFVTNRRPFGGSVFVDPIEGTALDVFTITAAGWVDPDEDFPLQFAFEILYLTEEELEGLDEISATDTIPLSQFSQSLSITTNLQVPPEGKKTVILSVARDAFGAVSRRLLANANSDVVVLNPFNEADDVDLDEINALIDDLTNTGDRTQIPNLCSAISSSLNELDEEDLAKFNSSDLIEVRETCFQAVVGLIDGDNDDIVVDADVVNLVASSVGSLTEKADEVNVELIADVDAQTSKLVDAMKDQVNDIARGDADPSVAVVIPDSFRQNIANAVSNVLGASELLFPPEAPVKFVDPKPGRRLQGQVDSCQVLGGARSNIQDIANLQTSVLVAGAPQVDVESANVKFGALREGLADIGSSLTNQITIPDSAGGNNFIILPEELAADLQGRNQNAGGDFSLVGTKFSKQIRCEVRDVEDIECNANLTYDGPRDGREGNVVSLDFLSLEQDQENNTLLIDEISAPIKILLDFPESVLDELAEIAEGCQDVIDNLNNNSEIREKVIKASEEIVCGLFDDEGTGDFNTTLCSVTGQEIVAGIPKIVCECFHATDYAAWNAFKYDVVNTLKEQLILTPLVILVLFVFFPIVVLLFLVLLLWAYIMDKRDAKNILKGALARVKLMRIIKSRQKRKFFDNIKRAQVETIMKVHDNVMEQSAKLLNSTNAVQTKKHALKKHRFYLFKQFYLAIKYEHSLFGLSRYDPNFSRVQRATVFISVFICSFGAAALLFELRSNVYEITVTVTVLVSLGAAILVGIPIKFLGRALFKTTENSAGSQQDQVNNMYKIITRVELADGLETETDEELVEAIHNFYVVEAKFGRMLEAHDEESEVDDSKLEIAAVVEADDDDGLPIAEEYRMAKKALSVATYSARNVWREAKADEHGSGRFYSSWSKIKSIRGQSSSLLKVATLVSGEPSKQARARDSKLPYWVVIVDWFFLGVVVFFYSYYSVLFVGTRSTRAEKGFPDHIDADFEPLTEAEYLQEWAIGAAGGLVVSYLVAEPLIALFRYILLPLLVAKFGKKDLDPEDMDLDQLDIKQLDEAKEKKNIREGYSHLGFDLVADLVENFF